MAEIFKIWLLHREIGMCILEQTFEQLPKDVDSDLVGGFLTAMLSFSQEIANEKIERIQLETISIQYYISEIYILAAVCDKTISYNLIKDKLERIASEFNEKYGDILKNFHGNVDLFQQFGSDMEGIVERPTISLRYIDKTKEQLEVYLSKRKSDFDTMMHYLDNYIEKKASEIKGQVFGTFEGIKSKIKQKLNKKDSN